MPNRIIREGILTSERVDQLDPPSEVFYRRLMNKVDDHGLYDARPSILRSSLFPLRIDRVREADISRWIAACEKAGVIALYQHDGKPYLQMLDTKWQTRSEAKYPLPPSFNGKQMQPPANSCAQLGTKTESLSNNEDEVTPSLRSGVCPEPPAATGPAAIVWSYDAIGGMFHVTQNQLDRWQEVYTGLNVIEQLGRMGAWLEANRTRRKTKGGMPKFIVTWLSREQDKPKGVFNAAHQHASRKQSAAEIHAAGTADAFATQPVGQPDLH